uniref:Uncharacterized protein n=1 Tax=Anopheles dirus TaxID=7168 RepID=A0A182NRA5_9DIPT
MAENIHSNIPDVPSSSASSLAKEISDMQNPMNQILQNQHTFAQQQEEMLTEQKLIWAEINLLQDILSPRPKCYSEM